MTLATKRPVLPKPVRQRPIIIKLQKEITDINFDKKKKKKKNPSPQKKKKKKKIKKKKKNKKRKKKREPRIGKGGCSIGG